MLTINNILDLIKTGKINESNLSSKDLIKVEFYRNKLNEAKFTTDMKTKIEEYFTKYSGTPLSYLKISSNGVKIDGSFVINTEGATEIPFVIQSCKNIYVHSGLMKVLFFGQTKITGDTVKIANAPNLLQIDFPDTFKDGYKVKIILLNLPKLDNCIYIPACQILDIDNCNISWLNETHIHPNKITFTNCKDIEIDGNNMKSTNTIEFDHSCTIKSIKNFKREIKIYFNDTITDLSFLDKSCDGLRLLQLQSCKNLKSVKSDLEMWELGIIDCDNLSSLKGISPLTGKLNISGNESLKNLRFLSDNTNVEIYIDGGRYLKSLKNIIKNKQTPNHKFDLLSKLRETSLRFDDIEQIFEPEFFKYIIDKTPDSYYYDMINYIKILNNHINIELSEDEIKKLYSEIKNNNKYYPEFNKMVLEHIEELYPFVSQ